MTSTVFGSTTKGELNRNLRLRRRLPNRKSSQRNPRWKRRSPISRPTPSISSGRSRNRLARKKSQSGRQSYLLLLLTLMKMSKLSSTSKEAKLCLMTANSSINLAKSLLRRQKKKPKLKQKFRNLRRKSILSRNQNPRKSPNRLNLRQRITR